MHKKWLNVVLPNSVLAMLRHKNNCFWMHLVLRHNENLHLQHFKSWNRIQTFERYFVWLGLLFEKLLKKSRHWLFFMKTISFTLFQRRKKSAAMSRDNVARAEVMGQYNYSVYFRQTNIAIVPRSHGTRYVIDNWRPSSHV